MIDIFTSLTILGMGSAFGIALAALIIVHPLLLKVENKTAIKIFKPFFNKTHNCVLSLSIIVTLLALITSVLSGNWLWFGIAMIMHLNGPYTYFLMMPTNLRLLDDDIDPDSEQTELDLKDWGKLHAVRVLINGIVFVGFVLVTIYKA